MNRRKWLVPVLVAFPAMFFGVACDRDYNSVKTLSTTDRDENGWPLYRVQEEKFAIAMPPDWEHMDVADSLEKNIRANLRNNPEFSDMWTTMKRQLPTGVKFFAVEEGSMNTTFITNLTVVRLRHEVKYTLDQMVDIYLNEFDKIDSITKVSHERTKIAAGDAERFLTTKKVEGRRGMSLKIQSTTFVFMKGYDSFEVSMTTIPERFPKYEPIFDKIGQSFRLTQ